MTITESPATAVDYEAVIGLETHVELGTVSKMFCGCATTFGAEPNTHVCAGLPGPARVAAGGQRGGDRADRAHRARAQLRDPSAGAASPARTTSIRTCRRTSRSASTTSRSASAAISTSTVDGEVHRVGITRVHMEEDTGKSLHVGGSDGRIHGATHSLLDYNRAGVPLVEIVTEPDIRSAEVAAAYVTELREILRAVGVSEAQMEQGQLRCDANVSRSPARHREVRHPHRDQEPQLDSLGRAGRSRTRSAGRPS